MSEKLKVLDFSIQEKDILSQKLKVLDFSIPSSPLIYTSPGSKNLALSISRSSSRIVIVLLIFITFLSNLIKNIRGRIAVITHDSALSVHNHSFFLKLTLSRPYSSFHCSHSIQLHCIFPLSSR